MKLSRLAEAEELWQAVVDVGEPRTALTAQLNWAGACLSQSQSQQAAGHWREALRLSREVKNFHDEACVLANLAHFQQVVPELMRMQPGAAVRHAELVEVLQNLGRSLDDVCIICQSDFDAHPDIFPQQPAVAPSVLPTCFHVYHVKCIRDYWESVQGNEERPRCPMCRS